MIFRKANLSGRARETISLIMVSCRPVVVVLDWL